jgi:polyisoprenoid-binding protein YceI
MTAAILALALAVPGLPMPGAWAAGKYKEDAATGALLPPAQAARPSAPVWRIVPEKSSLTFTASQIGQSFTGRFGKFGADLTLDPTNLNDAKLTATVDLSSVDAGDKQRNEALPGEDWFDVAGFPRATFKSHKFVKKDGRSFEVTGMLAIKGIERQVTIPFTLTPTGDTATIKGGFTIKRTDFDVGEGQWSTGQWIGLDVAVTIEAVAVKATK